MIPLWSSISSFLRDRKPEAPSTRTVDVGMRNMDVVSMRAALRDGAVSSGMKEPVVYDEKVSLVMKILSLLIRRTSAEKCEPGQLGDV